MNAKIRVERTTPFVADNFAPAVAVHMNISTAVVGAVIRVCSAVPSEDWAEEISKYLKGSGHSNDYIDKKKLVKTYLDAVERAFDTTRVANLLRENPRGLSKVKNRINP